MTLDLEDLSALLVVDIFENCDAIFTHIRTYGFSSYSVVGRGSPTWIAMVSHHVVDVIAEIAELERIAIAARSITV